MHQQPPASAIQEFQRLYEKHHGIVLPLDEAATKLTAFLGLLSAVREFPSECAASRVGAAQDRAAASRRVCRSNGTPILTIQKHDK